MLYKTYKKTAGRGNVTARVASVRRRAERSDHEDVDEANRLDVLGPDADRVLGDAMDSMWTAWERFDQGEVRARAAPTACAGGFKRIASNLSHPAGLVGVPRPGLAAPNRTRPVPGR